MPIEIVESHAVVPGHFTKFNITEDGIRQVVRIVLEEIEKGKEIAAESDETPKWLPGREDFACTVGGKRRPSIEEFAFWHDLKPCFGRRDFVIADMRCYVGFVYIEVKDGGILRSPRGNGATREEALADYSRKISGKLLVWHAGAPSMRREIQVPELAEK